MTTNKILLDIQNNKDMDKTELYEKLTKKYLAKKVAFVMYDIFQYIHKETDEKEKRTNQKIFRDDLIERYSGCIITGVSNIVCDACHIIPHSVCEDKNKYNVDNGLLLRSDLHILFDKNLLKIDPCTTKIILDKTILSNEKMTQYHELNNKKINIHKNSIEFLKELFQNNVV